MRRFAILHPEATRFGDDLTDGTVVEILGEDAHDPDTWDGCVVEVRDVESGRRQWARPRELTMLDEPARRQP